MINMTAEELDAYSGLQTLQQMVFHTATVGGWHKNKREFGGRIACMHAELSEAFTAYRKFLKDDKLPQRPGWEVELADCLILLLDTAVEFNLDIAGAVIEKNRFNQQRADHRQENAERSGY